MTAEVSPPTGSTSTNRWPSANMLASITGDPLLFEQMDYFADREVGCWNDGHGYECLPLDVVQFPPIATPTWLNATLSRHQHLSATFGKALHVDLESSRLVRRVSQKASV